MSDIVNDAGYLELIQALSQHALCLWGKTNKENQDLWLPLYMHLSDTVAIAEKLWDCWLSPGTKVVVSEAIKKTGSNTLPGQSDTDYLGQAKILFLACAAVHDIGKATPAFQHKAKYLCPDLYTAVRGTGLLFGDMSSPEKVPHALASQGIIERYGWNRNLAVVLGGHHGKPPSKAMVADDLTSYPNNTGFEDLAWLSVQDELVRFALGLIGMQKDDILFQAKICKPAQIILTGLLIMADWIASDEYHFGYVPNPVILSALESPQHRAAAAWEALEWPIPWSASGAWESEGIFAEHFGFLPRPMQQAVIGALGATATPGIVVLEAPMGEGKTEAALAAAEILAAKTGRSGLFVALPTQATSDGLFPRVKQWIEKLDGDAHTISLMHGKAQFNSEYQDILYRKSRPSSIGIDVEEKPQLAGVIVNEWFRGRKKSMLADFVVGTIDQVLMGGLKQKHLALRHLALSNKIVIIDECHAYDAYMSQYLYKVLSWLGAYKVPVVVLSATLPAEKRKQCISSYTGIDFTPRTQGIAHLGIPATVTSDPSWVTNSSYPLLTYTDNSVVKQVEPPQSSRSLVIAVSRLDDDLLILRLEKALAEGGCAGVIVNTVARAQAFADLCTERFGGDMVELFHSQFIAPDRIRKETELRKKLGPPSDNGSRPQRLIVVGTQVLEQSLDIDFDILFTDICPMDLLIQRMGRMHRHEGRIRPARLRNAQCFVLGFSEEEGFDRGVSSVYGNYLLFNTDFLLPSRVTLPDDISLLVQATYTASGFEVPASKEEAYQKAHNDYDRRITEQKQKAQTFQISDPDTGSDTLVGWLNTGIDNDPSGKRGEATVRDSGDSIEVLVIQRLSDGTLRMPPWTGDGRAIPYDAIPAAHLARKMAQCSVRLPSCLCMPWSIDKTIKDLETSNLELLPDTWQESEWLRGELFLIFDENFCTGLNGYLLRYSQQAGLSIERRHNDDRKTV